MELQHVPRTRTLFLILILNCDGIVCFESTLSLRNVSQRVTDKQYTEILACDRSFLCSNCTNCNTKDQNDEKFLLSHGICYQSMVILLSFFSTYPWLLQIHENRICPDLIESPIQSLTNSQYDISRFNLAKSPQKSKLKSLHQTHASKETKWTKWHNWNISLEKPPVPHLWLQFESFIDNHILMDSFIKISRQSWISQ